MLPLRLYPHLLLFEGHLFEIVSGFVSNPEMLVYYGPTVHVDIGFDEQFRPADGQYPHLPARRLPALVDTGATESCIDTDLAIELNLPIVDHKRVSGIHGTREVNYHVAQIHIAELPFTIFGMFAGVSLRSAGQPHFALLGRTFLRQFTMIYHGRDGRVVITND